MAVCPEVELADELLELDAVPFPVLASAELDNAGPPCIRQLNLQDKLSPKQARYSPSSGQVDCGIKAIASRFLTAQIEALLSAKPYVREIKS